MLTNIIQFPVSKAFHPGLSPLANMAPVAHLLIALFVLFAESALNCLGAWTRTRILEAAPSGFQSQCQVIKPSLTFISSSVKWSYVCQSLPTELIQRWKLGGTDRLLKGVAATQQRTHLSSVTTELSSQLGAAKHRGELGLKDTRSNPGSCKHISSCYNLRHHQRLSGVLAKVETSIPWEWNYIR